MGKKHRRHFWVSFAAMITRMLKMFGYAYIPCTFDPFSSEFAQLCEAKIVIY